MSPARYLAVTVLVGVLDACAVHSDGLVDDAGPATPGVLPGATTGPTMAAGGPDVGAAVEGPKAQLDGAATAPGTMRDADPAPDAAVGSGTTPLMPMVDAAGARNVDGAGAVNPSTDAPAAEAHPAMPPDDSLVAHWKFDEAAGRTVASDSSGNGNDGTLAGPESPTPWQPGRLGNAFHVVGMNRILMVRPSPSIASMSANFTVAAWVNKDVVRDENYRSMISQQAGNGNRDGNIFKFGFYNGRLRFTADGLTDLTAMGQALPQIGQWGHVAATYDGTTLRLYLNGTEIAGVKVSGRLRSGDRSIIIGNDQNGAGPDEALEGFLDDLRLYSRALGAAELAALAK